MWRWIKRLFFALLVLLAVAGGALYWLHRQTKHVPDFYTEALARMPEKPEIASAELTREVEQLQANAGREGAWTASFTDEQINAWLLQELPKKFPKMKAQGVSDPRLVIEDERMLVAAKYTRRGVETVVSFEVAVKLTEQPNLLAIQIRNLRAGALPLPMQSFLDRIKKEAAKGDVGVEWDLTDDGPVALVSVPQEHPKYIVSPVIVESIQLTEGTLCLTGHSGELATDSYMPRSDVHRFVSYEPDSSSVNRAIHSTADADLPHPHNEPVDSGRRARRAASRAPLLR